MKQIIPQIKKIEVGIDVGGTDGSYDVVLISEFENELDCRIYMEHPEHLRAADFIGKIRPDRIPVDYTI